MPLLEHPALVQDSFVVTFEELDLHLLHYETLQKNERHVVFILLIFSDHDGVLKSLMVEFNLLVFDV